MKQITHVDEIINSSFGSWVTSLFSAISEWNHGISFMEQKEEFFWLLEFLLKNGKIKFIAPGADCYVSPSNPNPRFTIYDHEAQWQASTSEIINYFRNHWPPDVSEENDPNLLTYFYEMPGIIWVDQNGDLVGP